MNIKDVIPFKSKLNGGATCEVCFNRKLSVYYYFFDEYFQLESLNKYYREFKEPTNYLIACSKECAEFGMLRMV